MLTPWRAALWLGLAAKSAEGGNWAVLVAGSSGWYNYRHQVRASSSQSIEFPTPQQQYIDDFVDLCHTELAGYELGMGTVAFLLLIESSFSPKEGI